MWKWLHHLFNPHCEWCESIRLDEKFREDRLKSCRTCEVYEMEVARLRADNERLLNLVLQGNVTLGAGATTQITELTPQLKPIQPPINWRERRRILENESRAQARIINEQQNELIKANKTEDLENALKVDIPSEANIENLGRQV